MASSRRHECKNKPDSFCYVCGCYILLRQRPNITSFVKRAYKAYSQIPLGDKDKKWLSHIVCHTYEKILSDWTKAKREGLPFVVRMFWRKPRDHVTDAIFAWSTRKVLSRKIGIRSLIQAFPQLFDP